MDVWFDSGSTHQAVLRGRKELEWPANLYLEGSDQFRGWFQSSLLTSVATTGSPPFKEVLSHGWVVDGEGKKMSKSLGNVILPEEVIKDYGADILRLWVSSADFTTDIHLSADILKQLSEVYRKIRNTARFLLGNLQDFDPTTDSVPYEKMGSLDRWALHRLARLTKTVTEAYEKYEFHRLFYAVHNFSSVEMSSFYLDVIKDRLYCSDPQSLPRRACQTVLLEVLRTLTVLIAPVLSFTAEEIWSYLPEKSEDSVFFARWPKESEKYYNEALELAWKPVLSIREDVLRILEQARREKVIGSSLQATLHLYLPREWREKIKDFQDRLAELFIVSNCRIHPLEDVVKEKLESLTQGLEVTDLFLEVLPAEGEKCSRCWMVCEEVVAGQKDVCARCEEVLLGLAQKMNK